MVLLVASSWSFLAAGAGMAEPMDMPGMSPPPLAGLVLMWWIMMAAMMLPSASPAILLYARVRSQRNDRSLAAPWTFLAGYFLVWTGFSLGAAVLQHSLLDDSMRLDGRLAGGLLIAVGLYQVSPLKQACLGQCRSPAAFISRHWRSGPAGALRLGLLHGIYCLGCCWLLMALLFVGGVMNLLLVAGLTLLVAAEKLVPRGDLLSKLTGVALLLLGAGLLAGL